ncbi:Expansin protein 5 [Phytophthora cinnamomi]|uniref:Expansin protein 5 n=1 Tax=Phytophthora cinnamomi TaxID=4785 RepID=UPI0035595865|nr:Expansin protein 5 [Phytophthora cinnamomi]
MKRRYQLHDEDVSDGNCNFMSAIPTASTNYAALDNDQWDDLANCGWCAEVSCVDDQCTDQSATAIVQILDRCPECSSGDLDLSPCGGFRTRTPTGGAGTP